MLAVTAVMAGTAVGVVTVASPAGATPTTLARYQSVPPSRLLDTRTGIGAPQGQVPSGGHVAVQVTGRGGVPSTGVSAVVLNVTVTNPTGPGNATVYADLTTPPTTSNLNYVTGQTVANLVLAPVGTDGKVDIAVYKKADLIADVSGYYVSGTATATGTYGAVTPARLLDTRHGIGAPLAPVPSGGHVAVQVTGQGGVPSDGVSAVVLNVTVANPTGPGNATAYADLTTPPNTSNLNYVAGQTVPNLVIVPVGTDGKVDIGVYRQTDLIADVFGYFVGGSPVEAGTFGALSPARLLDTRNGIGAAKAPVASGGHVALQVAGQGGVPSTGVSAVVLNVTVTNPAGAGNATVWADQTPQPSTSNVNYVKGQTVPNLVIAPVGPDGKVDLGVYTKADLLADVSGYFVIGAPQTSTSRYVRDITGGSGDQAIMNTEGCDDATANAAAAGNYLMLLDIGAQTIHAPLSVLNPGVALSGTNPVVRVSYTALVTAIKGYIAGYATCASSGQHATIVVGTSNDGDWAGYLATNRGQDWATKVIVPLQTYALTKIGIEVDAGMDAEAGFASTEANVETWMTSYLGKAPSGGTLYDHGSADGCPTTLGQVGMSCQAVSNGNGGTNTWTQAQYYRMAHGLSPRIVALPQIYSATMAIQWANIDRAGASATDHIDFVGALTSNSACSLPGSGCTSLTPLQGFDAFSAYLSTGTYTAPTGLTYATDLQVDSPAA